MVIFQLVDEDSNTAGATVSEATYFSDVVSQKAMVQQTQGLEPGK